MTPTGQILRRDSHFYYLDGNAVTFLWDSYTTYKREGATGDPIAFSPFKDAVVSEYTLDELITIPISTPYKKHLAFLSIFQDLPVFSSITKFSPEELASATEIDILAAPEFLKGLVTTRLLALTSPEYRGYLEQDIQNKATARLTAELHLKNPLGGYFDYVDPENRISIRETIAQIISTYKLDPVASPYDFHLLCMHLFVATRDRLIDVPAKYRKGPTKTLSHQIDLYHLSYLPFVEGFVTNDAYLSLVATEVVQYLSLNKKIVSMEEFWTRWIRVHLLGSGS